MAIANVEITTSVVDVVTAAAPLTNTVINFCNYGAVAEKITIYAIPSGGSASNSTILVKSFSIPAGNSWEYTTKLIFGTGDKVSVQGTTGGLVTATVSTIAL